MTSYAALGQMRAAGAYSTAGRAQLSAKKTYTEAALHQTETDRNARLQQLQRENQLRRRRKQQAAKEQERKERERQEAVLRERAAERERYVASMRHAITSMRGKRQSNGDGGSDGAHGEPIKFKARVAPGFGQLPAMSPIKVHPGGNAFEISLDHEPTFHDGDMTTATNSSGFTLGNGSTISDRVAARVAEAEGRPWAVRGAGAGSTAGQPSFIADGNGRLKRPAQAKVSGKLADRRAQLVGMTQGDALEAALATGGSDGSTGGSWGRGSGSLIDSLDLSGSGVADRLPAIVGAMQRDDAGPSGSGKRASSAADSRAAGSRIPVPGGRLAAAAAAQGTSSATLLESLDLGLPPRPRKLAPMGPSAAPRSRLRAPVAQASRPDSSRPQASKPLPALDVDVQLPTADAERCKTPPRGRVPPPVPPAASGPRPDTADLFTFQAKTTAGSTTGAPPADAAKEARIRASTEVFLAAEELARESGVSASQILATLYQVPRETDMQLLPVDPRRTRGKGKGKLTALNKPSKHVSKATRRPPGPTGSQRTAPQRTAPAGPTASQRTAPAPAPAPAASTLHDVPTHLSMDMRRLEASIERLDRELETKNKNLANLTAAEPQVRADDDSFEFAPPPLDTLADDEMLVAEEDDETVLVDDEYAPTEVSFVSSYLTEVSDLTMASTGNNRYGAVRTQAGPLIRPRRRNDATGNVNSRANRRHPLGHERIL